MEVTRTEDLHRHRTEDLHRHMDTLHRIMTITDCPTCGSDRDFDDPADCPTCGGERVIVTDSRLVIR